MRNRIKNLLKEKIITDIISVGFVDIENDTAQFYPNPQWLYFEFDDNYIEFESMEQYSKLRIRFSNFKNEVKCFCQFNYLTFSGNCLIIKKVFITIIQHLFTVFHRRNLNIPLTE